MTTTPELTAGAVNTAAVDIPEGANPRGTVTVLAGRGESVAVYERFANRIAIDSYSVRVVTGSSVDPEAAAIAVRTILADPDLPAPHFLVGSDAGAVLALHEAVGETPAAGVVVAGLLVPGGDGQAEARTGAAEDHDEQIIQRSSCPAHQSVLQQPENFDAKGLTEPLPPGLVLPKPATVTVPVLAFYGDCDSVVDTHGGTDWLARLPDAEVLRTTDGAHDALNDKTHRSVAAHIVQFFEDIKNGAPILH